MTRGFKKLRRGPKVLIAAAAVFAALSVASRWSDVFVGVREHAIFITEGGVWLMRRPDVKRFEHYFSTPEPKWHWWPPAGYTRGIRNSHALDIRLWVPPLACLVGAGGLQVLAARRRRARERAGVCARCGYDRRSIDASLPCPECGEARALAAPAVTTR